MTNEIKPMNRSMIFNFSFTIFFLIISIIKYSHADIDYDRIYMQDYCDSNTTTVFSVNDSNPFGFIFASVERYYEPGKNCKIRLEAYPKHHRITTRFQFVDIYTSSGHQCLQDKLVVSGETNNKNYCGRWKPPESLYSSANYLNFTFITTYEPPPQIYTGFKISYTKYHTGECQSDEFQCWYGDRCIPEDLRCDGIDNCGDYSDERYCSTISTFGSVILTTSIVISLGVMLTVVCACMVKLILGKRSRRNSTSTPPLPQSFLDQTTSQTNPLSHYPPPQAQPGSVNPYNEPPPSYYYAHFTSAVDKMEEEGSGEREGSVRIIPVPSDAPTNTNNSEIGRNLDSNTHPPLSELPPYETYKDDCCMDPQLLEELQEANDNNHNIPDANSVQMNASSDNISNASTINNFTNSTSSNTCNDNLTNGNISNSAINNATFDSNSVKSIGKNKNNDGERKAGVYNNAFLNEE